MCGGVASTLPYPSIQRSALARNSRRHRDDSLAAKPPCDLLVEPSRQWARAFTQPAQAGARLTAAVGCRERENSGLDRVLHPLVAGLVDLECDELEAHPSRERSHGVNRISSDGLRDNHYLVGGIECRWDQKGRHTEWHTEPVAGP